MDQSHESNACKEMDRSDSKYVMVVIALMLVVITVGIWRDGIGWWLVTLVCGAICAGCLGFILGGRFMRRLWLR